MTSSRLYTMKEASDLIRLSITRTRTLIKTGRIQNAIQHAPKTKILIPEESLQDYLKTK
jgi:hypothetical protein